jgi:hypothetical protein
MSDSDDTNRFKRLESPPPPMFLGQKERDFQKQVSEELTERVIGQGLLYYPIDTERTNFHPIYGEAPVKTFLNPVRVYALVLWEGMEITYEDNVGVDARASIEIRFHKRRISDDQNILVKAGDFVMWGDSYYKVNSVGQPKLLWGQSDQRFEVVAKCILARRGQFNAS